MTDRPPFLVLGLGNELFTDEGVGVVAARRLAERCPPEVEVVDGGTLGIALLPVLEGRDGLLVFDAVTAVGLLPGQVVELGPDDLDQPRMLLYSAHQVGIADTLAAARLVGTAPARLAAVGLVPYSLETGYGLSPGAAAKVDAMVERGQAILARWGVAEVSHA